MTKITVQLCLTVWSSVSVLMYQSTNPQKPTLYICWDTLFTANPLRFMIPQITSSFVYWKPQSALLPRKEAHNIQIAPTWMNIELAMLEKRVRSLMGVACNLTVNQFGKREGSLRGLLPLLMLNKKWKPQQCGVKVCVCDFWRKLGGDFTLGGRKKIRANESERESTIKSTMTVQVALCPLLDCNVTAGHSRLFYLTAATFFF